MTLTPSNLPLLLSTLSGAVVRVRWARLVARAAPRREGDPLEARRGAASGYEEEALIIEAALIDVDRVQLQAWIERPDEGHVVLPPAERAATLVTDDDLEHLEVRRDDDDDENDRRLLALTLRRGGGALYVQSTLVEALGFGAGGGDAPTVHLDREPMLPRRG